MGLLARVRELQEIPEDRPQVSSRGLLARSRELQKRAYKETDSTTQNREELLPEMIIQRIASGMENIGYGIDAPYLLFEALRKSLGEPEGIFLLPDHTEKVLVPYSATQYYSEYLSRFRIPEERVSTLNSVQYLKNKDETGDWKPYFPPAAVPKRLLVIPCGTGAKKGLLLINKSSILELDDRDILLVTTTLSNLLQNMIRENMTTLHQNLGTKFSDTSNEFIRLLQKGAKDKSHLLISIPREQLNRIFAQSIPSAWKRSLERDCLRILGSIVQEDGALSFDEENFYVLFSDTGSQDNTLIREQLQTSFQQAFSIHLPKLKFGSPAPDTVLKSIHKTSGMLP